MTHENPPTLTPTPVRRIQREMRLTVAGGEVRLVYPDPIDAGDIVDIGEALAIWLRSIERRAVKDPSQ